MDAMISAVSRTYEELEVGAVYRSRFGRTVLEADNTWFTLLTLNTNPIHFDAEYAATTEWGRPLVDSTFTLALVTGLSVADVSERGVNLGWREVRLPAPVFAGDTIRAETEVLQKRDSESRPGFGIVTVRTRGLNQRDEVVIDFEGRSWCRCDRDRTPRPADAEALGCGAVRGALQRPDGDGVHRRRPSRDVHRSRVPGPAVARALGGERGRAVDRRAPRRRR